MIEVGQEVWFVPTDERRRKDARTLVVMKVGRKWADVGFTVGLPGDKNYGPHLQGRINIETLWMDGEGYQSPPGRCWLSHEAWEQEESRRAAWRELKGFIEHKYSAPEHLSEAVIRQALTLLAQAKP